MYVVIPNDDATQTVTPPSIFTCIKIKMYLKYIAELIAILTRILASAGMALFNIKTFMEQREHHPEYSLNLGISIFSLICSMYVNAVNRGWSIHHKFNPLEEKKADNSWHQLSWSRWSIYVFLVANNIISIAFSCVAGLLAGHTLYSGIRNDPHIDKHGLGGPSIALGVACIIGNLFSFIAYNLPKAQTTALDIARITWESFSLRKTGIVALSLFYVAANAVFCYFSNEKAYEALGGHPTRDTPFDNFLYATLIISAITAVINIITTMVPTAIEALDKYKIPTKEKKLNEKIWNAFSKNSGEEHYKWWAKPIYYGILFFGFFDSVGTAIGVYASFNSKVKPYNESLFEVVWPCVVSCFVNYATFNLLYGFNNMLKIYCERTYPELYTQLTAEAKNEIENKQARVNANVNDANGSNVIHSQMMNASPTFFQKCCPRSFSPDDQRQRLVGEEKTNGAEPNGTTAGP